MVNGAIPHEEARWGAHLPHLGLEPKGQSTTEVCGAVQCYARPTVTFPVIGHHCQQTGTKLYCMVTEAYVCEQLA